jgi:hypothetical protein
MKYTKYLFLPLAIACINVAQADNKDLPPKNVVLPFTNVPIFSQIHDGLFFVYNMNGAPVKKVVCTLSDVYKGWLEFSDQGVTRESALYGNGDSATITLTSKGPNEEDKYHADSAGFVKMNAINYGKGIHATASCHYEVDNNQLK